MMKRRHGMTVMMMVLVAWSVLVVDRPARADDSVSDEQMRRVIREIEGSQNARQAGEAYASVARLAPKHVELRDVYMRKLVALGASEAAATPARALTKLDPTNGLAWALTSCANAKRKKLALAFKGAVMAANLLGSDANVMNNIGQMAAWRDNEPDVKGLDAKTLADFEKSREAWAARKSFKQGYDRIQGGYEHHRELITEAEAAVEEKKEQIKDLEDSLRENKKEIVLSRERIKDLEAEIRIIRSRYLRTGAPRVPRGGGGVGISSIASAEAKELQAEQEHMGELLREKKQLRAQGKKRVKEWRAAKRNIDVVKRDKRKAFREAKAEFALKPPVRDGETDTPDETDKDEPDDPEKVSTDETAEDEADD
ncbi:hypothetical protein LCGC14_0269210 [marine sediment metagenome]|uniref:Uncharacterized protein n=1 Tax=marine sediment metagenome TaxID=412755 RepID=A0A0F9UGA2_9ZZZZ